MKNLFIILAFLLVCLSTQAQQSVQKKPSADLLQFFAGKWTGEGKFFNDKPITANLEFTVALDSSWLKLEHVDVTPNTYKATSMWGNDPQTGEYVAYVFDNYGGHRKFNAEGWANGKLILTTQQPNPKGGILWQHFIYEKLTTDSFKMTYEVSKDGTAWRMVDYLIFRKAGKV
ncbi:DUF1579 family protein [Pontibacter fetidus]|uniref:DUF1579 domain-containing protein n=1 Tax=Pontibacter fetidus TaxID=2700082 RepID=A0A6B2H5I4_9BACT|nr:DUF1579 family protein [Pontibacter fetidus]NDK54314.1 DUF1579 domain-containing protein [Pontibacter fetidus]